jgi:hypothetical protein
MGSYLSTDRLSRVGSPPASPPSGTSGRPATLPAPRASRAPSPAADHRRVWRGRARGRERSERVWWGRCRSRSPRRGKRAGWGRAWGAEGRSEPFEGSHISRLVHCLGLLPDYRPKTDSVACDVKRHAKRTGGFDGQSRKGHRGRGQNRGPPSRTSPATMRTRTGLRYPDEESPF